MERKGDEWRDRQKSKCEQEGTQRKRIGARTGLASEEARWASRGCIQQQWRGERAREAAMYSKRKKEGESTSMGRGRRETRRQE